MWTTAPAVVLAVRILLLLALLATIIMVAKLGGKYRVSVRWFGLGFTVERDDQEAKEILPVTEEAPPEKAIAEELRTKLSPHAGKRQSQHKDDASHLITRGD